MVYIGGFVGRFFTTVGGGGVGDQRLSFYTERFPNDFRTISRRFWYKLGYIIMYSEHCMY